jgi:hypothetical protein
VPVERKREPESRLGCGKLDADQIDRDLELSNARFEQPVGRRVSLQSNKHESGYTPVTDMVCLNKQTLSRESFTGQKKFQRKSVLCWVAR